MFSKTTNPITMNPILLLLLQAIMKHYKQYITILTSSLSQPEVLPTKQMLWLLTKPAVT
jgi:hypothetical protein